MIINIKKEVIRKLAHDLRGPLSVVMGYVDFKASHKMNQDETDYVEALNLCVTKIKSVADGIDALVPSPEMNSQLVVENLEPGQIAESGKPVLIVDDDASLRLQWRIFFKNKNVQVIEVKSGEELLSRRLDYHSFERAIVDYNYEGSALNGFDVIEFLRQKGVEQIHLCTGQYQEDEVQSRARALGLDHIIPKPLDRNYCERLFGR